MRAVFVIGLVVMIFNFRRLVGEMEPRISEEGPDFELIDALTECNESFRIEMSYIEAFNICGSFPDETDRTPKCYVRCVLEKTGVTLTGEEFDSERSVVVFAQDRNTTFVDTMKDVANECAKRSETCKCNRSYQYLKCLMKTEKQKCETNG